MSKWLAALPVYNEEHYVDDVLREVSKYAENILVIDDGSSDGTAERLAAWKDVHVERHPQNTGYGSALQTAFRYAIEQEYEYLITLDCDGQHQPKRLPQFLEACEGADIVSGSRYLKRYEGDSEPPTQRLKINRQITQQLNETLQLNLTDAFCGFKAYRVEALKRLDIKDNGYAMPLEVWVQAAMRGLRVIEIPVPLIYLDLSRSFGGALDESEKRLQYYNQCIASSIAVMEQRGFSLPTNQAFSQG
ncbi:glycosyltransferase family 2 protein [Aureliella helgolandensis]|uniref:Undecaprenyl-phosphate mannosyltransferase n=1 Tax=Aureliella helgolandensis TaxID=2527968 RepID=A0A518GAQ5_9BACT|nr:glycosyltransferase family 2 protein [Aureliella helgolandensis]QDV25684.1 Undecaprenyl-phosphate mannosyltransferase [Aureliella helgolandensis]